VSSRELTGWQVYAEFEAEQREKQPGTAPVMKGL
jgi:hypothetical protein